MEPGRTGYLFRLIIPGTQNHFEKYLPGGDGFENVLIFSGKQSGQKLFSSQNPSRRIEHILPFVSPSHKVERLAWQDLPPRLRAEQIQLPGHVVNFPPPVTRHGKQYTH